MKTEKKKENSMLYIFSNKVPTGGPETMHQFAARLKEYGVDVSVVYFDSDKKEVPKKLRAYNIPVAEKVNDIEENIMIVPEMFTRYLYNYKRIRKCIWWLSRDLYYGYNSLEGLIRCAQRQGINKVLYPIAVPLMYIKHKIVGPYFKFGKDKNEIFHLYNCEYARTYLVNRGVYKENMMYMCGPIRAEYFDCPHRNKELLLTYNPKKNYEFTKKILDVLQKKRPDITAVGIIGMNPEEIVELLCRCSVYIDFGHFPGPERIPREAVTCYCNIVTSRYGSAGNAEDVLVPSQYKFSAKRKNIFKIIKAIEELVDNYAEHVSEYDNYREKVRNQVVLFEKNSQKFADYFGLSKVSKF